MLGGKGDKVISLLCLFSDLASVSDVCVLDKTDGVVWEAHASMSGEAGVLN